MPDSPILVLAGSARALRRAPAIAAWVAQLGQESSGRLFEVVDLAALDLGLGDEPALPALGGAYASPATRAWSEQVGAAAGVVVVTPQYNWGYPAVVKNALDHLYGEWRAKPAAIVSYGGHGGGKCADQLRQVMEGGLKMRLAATMPALPLAGARITADDAQVDPAAEFAAQRADVLRALEELAALIDAVPGAA